MKTLNRKVDNEKVNLYLFGDEHLGDKNCDSLYLKNRIELCLNDPDGYAIVLGDVLNNATCSSVSDTYEEYLSPMAQVKTAVKWFEPIKDKILVWVSGNHEDRTYKNDGIDITYFIARELNVPYSSTSCLFFLRFGETTRHRPIAYSLYMRHGSGGGSTLGGKANKLERNANIVDADIYLMGHTHQSLIAQEDFFRTSWQNSTVERVTHYFINIGASLDYGGYGDKMGLRPSTKSHPTLHLDGHTRKVEVTV